MKITQNFSLAELTKSSTATRLGIDNTPKNDEIIVNLTNLCCNILQPVRTHFGRVVTINSGYRGPELNKAIGSKSTSQHCKGEAADFEIIGLSNSELAKWVYKNLDFDQIILEFHDPSDPNSGWVHCSHKKDGTNRKNGLIINKKTKGKYLPWKP